MKKITLLLFALASLTTAFAQSKINANLQAELAKRTTVNCLVVLREQADLSAANTLPTKDDKGWYVYNTLTQTADRSQKALKTLLRNENVQFQSFWAVNALHIEGANAAFLQKVAALTEVAEIMPDAEMSFHSPTKVTNEPTASRIVLPANHTLAANVTWGIAQIKADQVWQLGYTGANVVVGGQDTGYKWDIPTIKDKYRGWNGTTADHNFNWHDAIHVRDTHYVAENPFGYDLLEPIDDQQHGTHTMGTMVGSKDDTNTDIGVAPNAKWIGCRDMERGWGKPSTYIECFQWFIAPTNLQNTAPNPSKAPHVINNSWGCPPSEGCDASNFSVMNTVISNVKAAGVFVTVSAGNSGSGCGSINNPAAMFEPSFSVGATNSTDAIAGFSSRGPVAIDGSNRRKPNVSAPGVDVRSCTPDGSFQNWAGTSMAGPHVAGAVALIISARPALAGQVDLIENILEQTAEHLLTTENCGTDNATSMPNNTFGFGRIDVLRAVQSALTVVVGTESDKNESAFANIIPNPVQNSAVLQLKGIAGNTTLSVFNTAGQLLQTEQFYTTTDVFNKTIDFSAFANGIYLYTIYNGVQKISGKVVVAK
jgi:serine protease AprX